jgi:DNA-binding MarR family transcriptional regulator
MNELPVSGPSLPVLNDDHLGWEAKVGTTFLRVQSRIERRMNATLAVHGISLPQFDVLATLAHGEGITQQELAGHLLVSKGNVVGLIDRVSAAGWVERRPDPEDRRANRLYLTDSGRRILDAAWPCQSALIHRIFGTLTKPELQALHAMIIRVEVECSGCD